MSKRIYVIDPGHGGIDPKTGKYVTSGKHSPVWSDGSIYYEGVGNREIAKLVGDKLKAKGIRFKYTVDPSDHTDIGLTARAKVANNQMVNGPVVLISIHSNGHKDRSAHGYEVYTTPGKTNSDQLATIWFEEHSKEFKELKPRPDNSDGDPDKEEHFTVITATKCPSFLIETMFHSNEKECKILMSKEGKERIANVIVRTIERIEKL